MLTVHTTPTSPHVIIEMMCDIKSHNGSIMALGEICFFPNVTLRGIPVEGGEVYLGGNYDMKESAMLVVWFGSVKFQQLEDFQEEKLIFLPTQIYHLRN